MPTFYRYPPGYATKCARVRVARVEVKHDRRIVHLEYENGLRLPPAMCYALFEDDHATLSNLYGDGNPEPLHVPGPRAADVAT
jgi:hypothetical protein